MKSILGNKKSSFGNQDRYQIPMLRSRNSFGVEPSRQPMSLQRIRKSISNSQSYQMNNCEIYFDKNKKSNFMKGIVDKYFEQQQDTINNMNNARFQRNNNKNSKTAILNRTFMEENKINKLSTRRNINRLRNLTNNEKLEQMQSKKISLFGKNHSTIDRTTDSGLEPELLIKTTNTDGFRQNSINNMPSYYNSPPIMLLPPINQIDDKEDFTIDKSSLFDYSNYKTLQQVNPQRQSKIITYQNDVFIILLVLVNGKPKYRIKEYKPSGVQILRRENIAKNYKIESVWKQDKYCNIWLISSLVSPIKDHLCKIVSFTENKKIVYKITPRPYHQSLLADGNIELINFIKNICEILKKVENKTTNNKINPGNIFLINNKAVIAQWGYSWFKSTNSEGDSSIEPILRTKNQWLVTPEYLSPEILQLLSKDVKENKQQKNNAWEFGTSSDIWSLGCTIFQMLTLIPIWCSYKCCIKGKESVRRKGILGVEGRNLRSIIQKQQKIKKNMKKCLTTELETGDLNEKILQILLKMVEFDRKDRITLDQILEKLK